MCRFVSVSILQGDACRAGNGGIGRWDDTRKNEIGIVRMACVKNYDGMSIVLGKRRNRSRRRRRKGSGK